MTFSVLIGVEVDICPRRRLNTVGESKENKPRLGITDFLFGVSSSAYDL